jgi:hypothetical protein
MAGYSELTKISPEHTYFQSLHSDTQWILPNTTTSCEVSHTAHLAKLCGPYARFLNGRLQWVEKDFTTAYILPVSHASAVICTQTLNEYCLTQQPLSTYVKSPKLLISQNHMPGNETKHGEKIHWCDDIRGLCNGPVWRVPSLSCLLCFLDRPYIPAF